MSFDYKNDSFISLINNYLEGKIQVNDQKLTNLIKNVDPKDTRIKFEEWVLNYLKDNDFSPSTVLDGKVIIGLYAEALRNEVFVEAEAINVSRLLASLDVFPNTQDHKINAYSLALKTAIEEGEINKIHSIVRQNPQRFTSTWMSLENKDRLFHLLLFHNDTETMSLMISNGDAFKEVLKANLPNLMSAVAENNWNVLELIAQQAPSEFVEGILLQNTAGTTPLSLAAARHSLKILSLMAKIAPEEVGSALIVKDEDGKTPLFKAVIKNKPEILLLMAQVAPEKFKIGINMADSEGNRPILYAARANHIKIVKLIAELVPEALTFSNSEGTSALSLVKQMRPANYHSISSLFPRDSPLRHQYKDIYSKIAVSHAFHISGQSTLLSKNISVADQSPKVFRLEGYQPSSWFNQINKDLDVFRQVYPQLLDEKGGLILKEALEIGANQHFYSLEKKFERIKAGLPTLLHASSDVHAVTFLIWGDQLTICNRGTGIEKKRIPMDVFHFDINKLTPELINVIESPKTQEVYEALVDELFNKLDFTQTPQDRLLSIASKHLLPIQTVGNCSFVSPITSIFAFRALAQFRGINQEGCLGPDTSFSVHGEEDQISEDLIDTFSEEVQLAVQWYQSWLSFEQILILDRGITLAEISPFEADKDLIKEALRKAYLLPLDDLCGKQLETMTRKYLEMLTEKEQTQLKTDIVFWKTLSRQPLL